MDGLDSKVILGSQCYYENPIDVSGLFLEIDDMINNVILLPHIDS